MSGYRLIALVALLCGLMGRPGVANSAPFAYVVERNTSAPSVVRVIDAATNSIATTLTLPGSALCDAVALHPNAARLYVACGFDVVVVDTGTNSVVKTLSFSGWVDGLAANQAGTRVYAIKTGGALGVIDTSTDTVLHNYSGGPASDPRTREITVLRDSSAVYVTSGDVREYDPNTPTAPLRVFSAPSGQSPTDAESSADSSKLFVLTTSGTAPYPSSVYALDLATGAFSAPIALGTSGRSLSLNNAGTVLYVVSTAGSAPLYRPTIFEIDTSTMTVTDTLDTSCQFPAALSVNGADSAIFVVGDGSAGAPGVPNICKIDAASFSETSITSFGVLASSPGSWKSTFMLPGCAGCCG